MSARKPTLGYPSRTEAVLALRAQRLSTTAIAERIGIEPSTVAALEASAARSREFARDNKTVVFPVDLLKELRPHAARRDISVNELARRIVETIVGDGLIDAVLDDGVRA